MIKNSRKGEITLNFYSEDGFSGSTTFSTETEDPMERFKSFLEYCGVVDFYYDTTITIGNNEH